MAARLDKQTYQPTDPRDGTRFTGERKSSTASPLRVHGRISMGTQVRQGILIVPEACSSVLASRASPRPTWSGMGVGDPPRSVGLPSLLSRGSASGFVAHSSVAQLQLFGRSTKDPPQLRPLPPTLVSPSGPLHGAERAAAGAVRTETLVASDGPGSKTSSRLFSVISALFSSGSPRTRRPARPPDHSLT